jgi:probable rRNA maturation factor
VTLEVEVIGAGAPAETTELCALALASAGVADGHLAVELVDAERIRRLNLAHRGVDAPTDVLSFPVDEDGAARGPRELGDVVICPEHTHDLREAVVHGVLHLVGMDHERDDGEMLALQAELLAWTEPAANAEAATA